MPLEILKYIPLDKAGCKKAICDIKMLMWGPFIIHGISIFEKDGKRWITFPSDEYEKEGKKKWSQKCHFETENMTEAFRKEFFKELEKYQKANNPSVFDMPEKQTIQGKGKTSNDEECPF